MQKWACTARMIVMMCFIVPSSAYAKAILNIVPSSTSDITVSATGNSSVAYTITNSASHTINGLAINPSYGIPSGLLSTSLQSDTCSRTNLAAGASCTFTLSLQGKGQAGSHVLSPSVCGFSGTVCSQPIASNRVLVIVNVATTLTAISPDNGPLAGGQSITLSGYNLIGTTSVTFGGVAATINSVSDTTVNITTPAHSRGAVNVVLTAQAGVSTLFNAYAYSTFFAYITNSGNSTVSICPVNSNGSLGTCTTSSGNGTFSFPEGMTINPARTFAYVVNNNTSTISICPINSDGSLGTCTTSTGNGTFSLPNGISLNSSGTIAYVANNTTNTISICPVNSNGSLGTCTTSSGNGTLNGPNAIIVNSTGTFIYVPNFNNNTVSICLVNSDGFLGTCTTSTGNGTFSAPDGISLNSSDTFAYITNSGNSTVSICPVNNNGSLGTCTVNADATFNFSNGFAACLFMSSPTNYGYIPNDGGSSNTVSICPINPANGTLSPCIASTGNGTFADATGVALALLN